MKRITAFLALLIGWVSANADEQHFAELEWLSLSAGVALENCQIGYRIAGELNDERSNIVVIPTWFTGTSESLFSGGLIGPGKLADTNKYYVIAIDALGNGVSCSPSNTDTFPRISTEDMVNSQHWLLTEHLGFEHVHAVMGISMGGMQTFRWMSTFPSFMDKAIPIDGSPRMTSFDLLQWQTHKDIVRTMQGAGLGQKEIQEMLSSIGLLSLFTPDYFVEQVAVGDLAQFIADSDASYAELNVDDYVAQLEAMIDHDVIGESDESVAAYAQQVRADVLVIGAPSDHMVVQAPARRTARALAAPYFEIISNCGHIASSGCELESVTAQVAAFLASEH